MYVLYFICATTFMYVLMYDCKYQCHTKFTLPSKLQQKKFHHMKNARDLPLKTSITTLKLPTHLSNPYGTVCIKAYLGEKYTDMENLIQ